MKTAYRLVRLLGTTNIAPHCCCRLVAVLLPFCPDACHRYVRERCSSCAHATRAATQNFGFPLAPGKHAIPIHTSTPAAFLLQTSDLRTFGPSEDRIFGPISHRQVSAVSCGTTHDRGVIPPLSTSMPTIRFGPGP